MFGSKRSIIPALGLALLFSIASAFGQTPAKTLAFDVATIRPSAPLDPVKLQAQMQAGKMPRFGPHIDASRAEFNYMALKDLIAYAYKVKSYQVTGPDWLATERFDIVATLPAGGSKDDAPAMLLALLQERFKLTAHSDTQEHPVIGLVVAKGGPKLKESTDTAAPIDEDAPLKAGEMKIDTPDGPARVTQNGDGSATVNMGTRGTITQRMDAASQTLHLDSSKVTMEGFADMLTNVLQLGNPAGGRQVVDMTGLKGNYQVALDISLADLMAMARAQGMNAPAGPGAADASPALIPDDPSGGGSTVYASVQKLGLKLEPSKAKVEQVVVESADKTPTEN